MARPTSKRELITAANSRFEELWALIDSMTEERRLDAFSFEDRDENPRDVLG